ncbi:MAG: hypothetical protein WCI60_05270 [bacterium]
MKSFKEHLTESKRTYDFKVKIAGGFAPEQEASMKTLLDKYKVVNFKKSGQTPVQSFPLDFPRLTNTEVNIYEVSVDYPVASHELAHYLSAGLKISEQALVVRNPNEPSERYQEPGEKREGALLNDNNYSESPNVDSNDYYGSKYNDSLIKTLNNDLKAQRKAQGQVIPNGDDGKTTNDLPQGTVSPVAKS